MSKPVLQSDRSDVRALDLMFKALELQGREASIRILRFYCASQFLKWADLFPEAKA